MPVVAENDMVTDMREKSGFANHHMIIVLVVFFLTGCTILPEPIQSKHFGDEGPLGRCADFFSSLDHQISTAKTFDAGAFKVKDYPYLRANRFLVSFRKEVIDNNAFAAWIDRMQALDQDVRYHEILNLPPTGENTAAVSDKKDELLRQVADCGNFLKSIDFRDAETRQRLSNEISVPDEYILLHRVLGVYPVARLFVSRGVRRWHNEERSKFSIEAPEGWHAISYVPEKSGDMPTASQVVEEAFRDDLGIPKYSPEAMTALLQIYAPIWEVQTQGAYDRIGAPFWIREDKLGVDTRQPVTFTRISYTRFEKKILTQLNYTIWFPSRPKEKALDIYGGFLDGVTFRITLDKNGSPLLYETMHNCGCYYKAYPTDRLHVREKIDYANHLLFFHLLKLIVRIRS